MSLSRKLIGADETLRAGKILAYSVLMIFMGIIIVVSALTNDPSEAFSYGSIQINSILAGVLMIIGGIISFKVALVWANAVEKLFE